MEKEIRLLLLETQDRLNELESLSDLVEIALNMMDDCHSDRNRCRNRVSLLLSIFLSQSVPMFEELKGKLECSRALNKTSLCSPPSRVKP
jgi:hypothetical protein